MARLMLIVPAPADLVLGLTLIVAIPELLLVLNVEWFSLKPDIPDYISTLFSPHYILINFLDWFSARTSAKLPITFPCFAVNLSTTLKK